DESRVRELSAYSSVEFLSFATCLVPRAGRTCMERRLRYGIGNRRNFRGIFGQSENGFQAGFLALFGDLHADIDSNLQSDRLQNSLVSPEFLAGRNFVGRSWSR